MSKRITCDKQEPLAQQRRTRSPSIHPQLCALPSTYRGPSCAALIPKQPPDLVLTLRLLSQLYPDALAHGGSQERGQAAQQGHNVLGSRAQAHVPSRQLEPRESTWSLCGNGRQSLAAHSAWLLLLTKLGEGIREGEGNPFVGEVGLLLLQQRYTGFKHFTLASSHKSP